MTQPILLLLLLALSPINNIEAMLTPQDGKESHSIPVIALPHVQRYAERIAETVSPHVQDIPGLTNLISGYAIPTDDEIQKAPEQLETALRTDNLPLAYTALENLADPNGKTAPGTNADNNMCYLTYAVARNRQPALVEALLKYNADPNPLNHHEEPLILSLASNVNMVRLLINGGSRADATDHFEHTVLYNSISIICDTPFPEDAQYQVAKELIGSKANPNSRDNDGQTALYRSVVHHLIGFIKALLEEESVRTDINAIDYAGETALHCATLRVNALTTIPIFTLLINAGANLHARNKAGKSPLDLIKQYQPEKEEEIMEIINKKRAHP